MTHSKQVARECIDRARQNWGRGWSLLSNAQRKEAASYEIVRTLMTQDAQWVDNPQVALSRMNFIHAVVYAVLVELENFGGDYSHEN